MKHPFPHLVFGYGSLICPDSRAITAPTVAERHVIPVNAQNFERTWAKKSKRGMTSMGVRFREGVECVGVLVPVNEEELSQFDEREIGYDRVELKADDIFQIPFLADHFYENTFLAEDKLEVPRIWVYVQQLPIPATESHPIVQSYLDIILRGCLSISEEFADEFMKTTKGWDPAELSEDDVSSSNERDDANSENGYLSDDEMDDVVWIDDRKDPIYVRADVNYSLKKANELDRVLRKHRPEEFGKRKRKGKSQVHPFQVIN
jgi:hypothetical protein